MKPQCCVCRKRLPFDQFAASPKTKGGYARTCNLCKQRLKDVRDSTRTYDLFGNVIGKFCKRCTRWLPLSEFNVRKALREGVSRWCRDCHSGRNKEQYIPQTREYTLQRHYELTLADWELLFEQQGRKCAACGTTDPGSAKGWATDHIHGTKIVRGILCLGCNVALGHLKDSPERAEQLAAYLRKSNATT
jgi:hypothetical protein